MDLSAADVEEDVAVSAAKDTDVVDVVATADDPEEAALLANTYAETAAGLIEEDNKDVARQALAVVERQLADLSRAEHRGPIGRNRREDAARLETLIAVGTGSISLTSARDISLASGSSIIVANGGLTLSANQQSTPTSGGSRRTRT